MEGHNLGVKASKLIKDYMSLDSENTKFSCIALASNQADMYY